MKWTSLIYIEPFIPRSKIHILFKCTWNIFRDRLHNRTWIKPQEIKENLNYIKHFLGSQRPETRKQLQGKKIKNIQTHGDWIACYQTMNGSRMRSRKKSKSFWKKMKNEHTTVPNLLDTVKAVSRGKFIAFQAYVKKIQTLQINSCKNWRNIPYCFPQWPHQSAFPPTVQ